MGTTAKIVGYTRAGNLTLTLVFEHATKAQKTLSNATFEIRKMSVPDDLTWRKQNKVYSAGGEISNAELLNGLSGTKTGYRIKTVTISNKAGTGARVLGNGTSAKIVSYTKAGTLTLSIVFEHDTKEDKNITGAEFEITKGSAPLLTWTKQTKAFSSGIEITNVELLAGVTGSGKNGYTIKTVTIINTNGTGARVSGSGTSAKITSYNKVGTLTLTIVLQHDTKDDVTITGAQFEIYNIDIFHVTSHGKISVKEGINRSSLIRLTIPRMIDGKTVKVISHSGFKHCTNLISITISNSVTSIEREAFYNCRSLTRMTIPNSVTSIPYRAFYNCRSLTSVTMGNSVTSIEREAFYDCKSLTSITIPNSVTSIGSLVFSGCIKLTSVTMGNSVTSIGGSAFSGCQKLTSVTIGNSITSIGSSVFFGCSSLTSITIPNSVTSIGSSAFSGCISLTSITIPNKVTSIGSWAFAVCSNLTSVTIPNSVTSIASYTFQGCRSLTSITIPNSVTSIRDRAFFSCTSLTSIRIPNKVTSIGTQIFYSCSKLTSIEVPTAKVTAWRSNLKNGNTASVVGY